MEFVENETAYLTSPASTKYHGNTKGGLAAHSLAVIKIALDFSKSIFEKFGKFFGNNVTLFLYAWSKCIECIQKTKTDLQKVREWGEI